MLFNSSHLSSYLSFSCPLPISHFKNSSEKLDKWLLSSWYSSRFTDNNAYIWRKQKFSNDGRSSKKYYAMRHYHSEMKENFITSKYAFNDKDWRRGRSRGIKIKDIWCKEGRLIYRQTGFFSEEKFQVGFDKMVHHLYISLWTR